MKLSVQLHNKYTAALTWPKRKEGESFLKYVCTAKAKPSLTKGNSLLLDSGSAPVQLTAATELVNIFTRSASGAWIVAILGDYAVGDVVAIMRKSGTSTDVTLRAYQGPGKYQGQSLWTITV